MYVKSERGVRIEEIGKGGTEAKTGSDVTVTETGDPDWKE